MVRLDYQVCEFFSNGNQLVSGEDLRKTILTATNLPCEDISITINGKRLVQKALYIAGVVRLSPTVLGGKGGFGSMLRAIGAQIEKTTNREACRDLSGRRLRDINEEKRLKTWLSQEKEREQDKEDKKRQRIERLLQEPKHEFKDETYHEERTNLSEKLSDSLEQGLKRKHDAPSTSGVSKVNQTKKLRKKTLLDEEFEGLGDTDDDSEDEKAIALAT